MEAEEGPAPLEASEVYVLPEPMTAAAGLEREGAFRSRRTTARSAGARVAEVVKPERGGKGETASGLPLTVS